ncbi:MAG: bifunctional phosphoribosylaminoimidazolecarboxamide formyltransferase/IMP cyclohydrolase [Nitrospinota bacterium]
MDRGGIALRQKIARVVISLSNKEGALFLASKLAGLGIEIVSTGGTASKLREGGIEVVELSNYTGFPECLDGRVKSLHPKVHGGILAVRSNSEHMSKVEELDIKLIDMVIINLYPFKETINRSGSTLGEAIENIDIGGPAMIRSAAKNYKDVAVVVDPADYEGIIAELEENNATLSESSKEALACKAFRYTANYDSMIASYLPGAFKLDRDEFPTEKIISLSKVADLRYGENPHQRSAYYREMSNGDSTAEMANQLNGKELSYNNIVDMLEAYSLVQEFEGPSCAIIKHTNPAGCATSESSLKSYKLALATDSISAFGGVVAFNSEVDAEVATELNKLFLEIIIAPSYSSEALAILKQKKNLRLIEKKLRVDKVRRIDLKIIDGIALLQEEDSPTIIESNLKVVTDRTPTKEERLALMFGWKVAKHTKSNAIVYSTTHATIGVGAGQMSRVDSAQIGIIKGGDAIKGSAMSSDAFFPFRDAVDQAASVGVTAIIQPGGSINDKEVIKAANEHNIAMIFTGLRHFKH